MLKNKEPFLLFFEGKKRLRLNSLLEIFLFVCVLLWNKKYIFSYTFDLCGWVCDKTFSTRPISGNKTTFFGRTFYSVTFIKELWVTQDFLTVPLVRLSSNKFEVNDVINPPITKSHYFQYTEMFTFSLKNGFS